MALIDSNNFITHLVWSGLIDKATCGELKEAIELCTVKDTFSKADIVDMLEELKKKIEEIVKEEGGLINKKWADGLHYSEKIIQQKINALKGGEDEIN